MSRDGAALDGFGRAIHTSRMDRAAVIARLKAHEADLRAMGVIGLSLFGSVARGEAGPESDVDVALTLDPARRIGLFRYALIGEHLEDILEHKVDTVCEPVRKERLRQRIDQDRAHVF